MKKLVIVLICFIFVVGCGNEKITYKTVSSEEAYNIIETRDDIIVLDVRNKDEYDEGHIENAINIPLSEIETRIKEDVTDNLDTTILVYCKAGVRSKEASEILSGMGYTNIINMGGISSWKWEIEKSE